MSEKTELLRKCMYERLSDSMKKATEGLKKDLEDCDLPFELDVEEGTDNLLWKMIGTIQLAFIDWCITYKSDITAQQFFELPDEEKMTVGALRYIAEEFIEDLQAQYMNPNS